MWPRLGFGACGFHRHCSESHCGVVPACGGGAWTGLDHSWLGLSYVCMYVCMNTCIYIKCRNIADHTARSTFVEHVTAVQTKRPGPKPNHGDSSCHCLTLGWSSSKSVLRLLAVELSANCNINLRLSPIANVYYSNKYA